MMTASSAEELRKEGNELFKCGDYEGALTAYTQALSLGATPQDQAILHRNRAACHLKLEDYSKAESEASKGRGVWALVRSNGFSVVGKDSGTTEPSLSPPLVPDTRLSTCFPTSSAFPFLQLPSPFLRLKHRAPHSYPYLPLALKIYPYCSCLETVASWVLIELLFVLSH